MCSSATICPWHRRCEAIIQSDVFTAKVCHSLYEAELKVGHPNVGLSDLTIVGSKRPIIMLDKLDHRRTHLCLFSDSVYYFSLWSLLLLCAAVLAASCRPPLWPGPSLPPSEPSGLHNELWTGPAARPGALASLQPPACPLLAGPLQNWPADSGEEVMEKK